MEPVWIFKPKKAKSTLQTISYEKLGRMLISSQPSANFHETKEIVQNFFSQIPRTQQSILLEKTIELLKQNEDTLEEWPAVVYVVQVLFKKGFKKLDVLFNTKLKLGFFMEIMLHLAQEGKDLDVLKLELKAGSDKKKWEIHGQMQKMLDTTRKLVHLELPRVCSDEVLKLIGENCHILRTLNVRRSPITDKGLHYLTQNMVQVQPQSNELLTDWASVLFGIPGMLMPLETLVPHGKRVDCYQRRKSPLCQFLKTLKLSESEGVTYKGILVVLGLVSNIEYFGHFTLDNVFSNLIVATNKGIPSPTFNLDFIFMNSLTKERLEFIKSSCPKLTYFHIYKSVSIPLTSFESLNSLLYLHLDSRNGLYTDNDIMVISPSFRNSLECLTLSNGHENCNIHVVLHAFPTLKRLWLYFPTFTWNTYDVWDGNLQQKNITMIKLDGDVMAEAILKILECAINLEEIHVRKIVERSQNFLERLCSISESPKLNTFLVADVPFVTTEEDLMFFLSRFKNISSVGKLPFKVNFSPGFNATKCPSLHGP